MNKFYEKLITLEIIEVSLIAGGSEFCDCTMQNAELVLTVEKDSENKCRNWCCGSRHEKFDGQSGEFYVWNAEATEGSLRWKKC